MCHIKDSPLNSKDIYEKGNTKEQWDNAYSIVKGEDGMKIKFKRPKEEKDILLP